MMVGIGAESGGRAVGSVWLADSSWMDLIQIEQDLALSAPSRPSSCTRKSDATRARTVDGCD